VSTDRELLEHAAEVLWSLCKHCLTVKPTLDVPYRDAPELTPWTRWIERDARRAHDLSVEIRRHLRAPSSKD
jgi:hypothetical protein